MDIRNLLNPDSEDPVWVIGALGAGVGTLFGVAFDGNPLLGASIGGVVGLLFGLLLSEVR